MRASVCSVRTALVTLALLVLAATAAAAGSARTVTAPAPLIAIAFEGSRIAFASGFEAHDCNRVRVWNLSTRGVTKLGRKTHCERTSTGNSIAQLSLAGARALWIAYIGGNTREWSLWTATTSKPSPVRLRVASNDAGYPSPFQVGNGDVSRDGDLLPYSVDRTAVVLHSNGSRAFTWTASDRVVALSARAGEVAVASDDKTVTILDAHGKVLRQEAYDSLVGAVQLTGSGVLVQHRTTLELRSEGPAREWTIPQGAILAAASGTRAYYVLRSRVYSLSLTGASTHLLARGTAAALEGTRIAVADGRVVRLLAAG